MTSDTAGRDCLRVRVKQGAISGNPLDHVADNPVRLSRAGIVGRHTIPEHLEGGVASHAVLATQVRLLGAVHLGELDVLALELGGRLLVVRGEAISQRGPSRDAYFLQCPHPVHQQSSGAWLEAPTHMGQRTY